MAYQAINLMLIITVYMQSKIYSIIHLHATNANNFVHTCTHYYPMMVDDYIAYNA